MNNANSVEETDTDWTILALSYTSYDLVPSQRTWFQGINSKLTKLHYWMN